LADYESIRPLSDEERSLVQAFDRANVALSGLQWLEWIYIQNRQFETMAAVVRRVDQLVARKQAMVIRQDHRISCPATRSHGNRRKR
jgi:hypothetical protein